MGWRPQTGSRLRPSDWGLSSAWSDHRPRRRCSASRTGSGLCACLEYLLLRVTWYRAAMELEYLCSGHTSSRLLELSDGRLANHQLCGQDHAPSSPARVLQQLEQRACDFRALLPDALADRRQRRVELRGALAVGDC